MSALLRWFAGYEPLGEDFGLADDDLARRVRGVVERHLLDYRRSPSVTAETLLFRVELDVAALAEQREELRCPRFLGRLREAVIQSS